MINVGKLSQGHETDDRQRILYGSIVWRDTVTAEEAASAGFSAKLSSRMKTGELRLRYVVTDAQDDTRQNIDQCIELEGLPQPFGGLMWYCRCPISGRRCRNLYMPPGAHLFASRQTYRLRYRSQQVPPYERAIDQARKIRKRLGASCGIEDPVLRPGGMHMTTFDRHLERILHYEELAGDHLNRHLSSVHERLSRL